MELEGEREDNNNNNDDDEDDGCQEDTDLLQQTPVQWLELRSDCTDHFVYVRSNVDVKAVHTI